jgi:hypothetical protein
VQRQYGWLRKGFMVAKTGKNWKEREYNGNVTGIWWQNNSANNMGI